MITRTNAKSAEGFLIQLITEFKKCLFTAIDSASSLQPILLIIMSQS
ncbi:hypothetical protein PMIT1327_00810 [Prochlorococcus marinus str. MIT 1327]|nr:hypothetical protein PMIT1312_00415 [Prochlorococcus marinus str. MIT 1312]KZR82547.1 hypothetical protein PMIT1327_00810 [Prochlorococcus marinus str. MIT 1327]